jgi:hypothetical protein
MTTRTRRGEAAPEDRPRGTRIGRPGLFRRAMCVWLALLAAAFVNGALRELALAPMLGMVAAQPVSALILAAVITAAAWWLVRSTRSSHGLAEWLAVGLLWLLLTAAFEFGFFHYVAGEPWTDLIANYDPQRGGWFGLVQLANLLAPPAFGTRSPRNRGRAGP